MRNRSQPQGFSLIEVLLALVLSMVVMNGVLMMWLSLKNTGRTQEEVAQWQENGRLLSHILSRDLRVAGFIGCGHLSRDFPVLNHTHNSAFNLSLNNSLQGYEGDAVGVYYLALTPVVSLQADTHYNQLITGEKPVLKKGDVLLISTCSHAEIFQLAQVQTLSKQHQQILTPTENLNYLYTPTDQLGFLIKNTYFIANTGRKDNFNHPITALYVEEISGKNREILPNIASMKIFYALQTGASPTYLSAAQISANQNWSLVKQVKIVFLLKSAQKNLDKKWDIVVNLRER